MTGRDDSTDERRAAIVRAATQVFARYGYRKASMDEVARAAGLSRQGVYLHFPAKEQLFHEVVAAVLRAALAAGEAALADAALPLEDRLLHAFDAMYGQYVESIDSLHIAELLETSNRLAGGLVDAQEQAFLAAVTVALERAGVAARWAAAGLTARALAETLQAVAHGLKHHVAARAEFLDRMRIAVRLVARPA